MPEKKGNKMVRSGILLTLATTVLTGFRILRPMKLHAVAGTAFLAFTVVHLLMNNADSKRRKKVADQQN